MVKGIGIISVVFGHVYTDRFVYIFHVPLFFMLSGFLFKPSDTKTYIQKNTIRYIIPYFSFLVLLTILLVLLGELNLSKSHFFSMFYGGQKLVGTFGIFWFVTVLYFALIILNTIKFTPPLFSYIIDYKLYNSAIEFGLSIKPSGRTNRGCLYDCRKNYKKSLWRNGI